MHARRRTAFTLIEILIVVVIIGVAGALVVPSMLSAGTLGLQGAARLVASDIQYAQNEALASGSVRGVTFYPAEERYRMTDEQDRTLDLTWMRTGGRADVAPGDGHTVNFRTDNRFEGFDLQRADGGNTPIVLEFDELGAPMTGSQDVEILLAFGGTTFTVVVDGFTGRVSID